MERNIVTGANGAGKSFVARWMGAVRPEVPVVSFDAVKLTTGWAQRPRAEIEADLAEIVARPRWILEGGPSLLALALPRAQAVIWLDPPDWLRGVRLAWRPLRHLGRTRPEIPAGNRDWPHRQYRFAMRSLRAGARFRAGITAALGEAGDLPVWRCRTAREVQEAVDAWADLGA
ncbi:DNA topology modulation protein FlaR [Aestuariibius insulae]|uniref:DNA topology modulation protein FlaR n=1 Tax=Aestuariibius insulae TaxID=2058287 RepID=UPI00345E0E64